MAKKKSSSPSRRAVKKAATKKAVKKKTAKKPPTKKAVKKTAVKKAVKKSTVKKKTSKKAVKKSPTKKTVTKKVARKSVTQKSVKKKTKKQVKAEAKARSEKVIAKMKKKYPGLKTSTPGNPRATQYDPSRGARRKVTKRMSETPYTGIPHEDSPLKLFKTKKKPRKGKKELTDAQKKFNHQLKFNSFEINGVKTRFADIFDAKGNIKKGVVAVQRNGGKYHIVNDRNGVRGLVKQEER